MDDDNEDFTLENLVLIRELGAMMLQRRERREPLFLKYVFQIINGALIFAIILLIYSLVKIGGIG